MFQGLTDDLMCRRGACHVVGAQEMAAFGLLLILNQCKIGQIMVDRATICGGIEPVSEMLISVRGNLQVSPAWAMPDT